MKLMSTRLLLIPAFALGLAGCSDDSASKATDPLAETDSADETHTEPGEHHGGDHPGHDH